MAGEQGIVAKEDAWAKLLPKGFVNQRNISVNGRPKRKVAGVELQTSF